MRIFFDTESADIQANRIIFSNSGKIEETTIGFKNKNLEYHHEEQKELFSMQEDSSFLIINDGNSTKEVKFVEDLNQTQLDDLYLLWGMDVSFSSNAKASKVYVKN